MHELSIALSMIEQIEQQSAQHPGTVHTVHVRIGVLSGVDTEALRFAWEIARQETNLSATELKIETVPLLAHCPSCGQTHQPAIQSLFCPRCVTPVQEILAGRELELTSLEIDE